jgi:methionyl-tRNA formyltransferase
MMGGRQDMDTPGEPVGGGSTGMRVLFMGTPYFGVPTLQALCDYAAPNRVWSTGLDIVGVVTRLDKRAGRGRVETPSPVKAHAQELGVPVYQPGSLRNPEALTLLRRLAPDLIVVSAFGQILPPEVIHLPPHACLNVHASLLPRHRGASPIPAAILAGDAETGVTIMLMDEGLDTGPIVAQRATPIEPDEVAGELSPRLAELGASLLIEVLPRWLAGGIQPRPQDAARVTLTPILRKENGRLDWTLPAEELARHVRAYTPWPGAFTTWQGRQLKVLGAHPLPAAPAVPREPGRVFQAHVQGGRREVLACACGRGALALEMIQLEGKRALTAAEFARGYAPIVGARLGVPDEPSASDP